MDKNFIIVLLDKGVPFRDMDKGQAAVLLNNQISEVYIKNGLHRTMTVEKFNEEVKYNVVMLYNEIMADNDYKLIRDKELHYIFSEGMKGRLGTDKDIVITYKSLLRWIEGYVQHQERREALRTYYDNNRPKPIPIAAHELGDEDFHKMAVDALKDYIKYRAALKEQAERTLNGKFLGRNIQTIGDVMGPPISVNDYGGLRMSWLKKNGYAREGEKFLDVLARANDNGGKFVKLDDNESK